MYGKLLRILALPLAFLFFFSACSQALPQSLRYYEKAQSVENFKLYKKKIIEALDTAKAGYDFKEVVLGNDPEKPDEPYMVAYSFTIKGDLPAKLLVGLVNEDKLENYTLSLEIERDNIEDCKLKLNKYPYFYTILAILSDLEINKSDLNSTIRSGRKGSVKAFERDGEAFFTKKEKVLYDADGQKRTADYSIYYESAHNPPIFIESILLKGPSEEIKD